MNQQSRRAAPGLAVDIHDGGFGHHALRLRVIGRVALLDEIEPQVMRTGGIGFAGEGFGFASRRRGRIANNHSRTTRAARCQR